MPTDSGPDAPRARRDPEPRFRAAIERQEPSLDVAADDEALATLRSTVAACGAVLLGEVHGVTAFAPRPCAPRQPRLTQLADRRFRLHVPRAHPAVVARLAPRAR